MAINDGGNLGRSDTFDFTGMAENTVGADAEAILHAMTNAVWSWGGSDYQSSGGRCLVVYVN